MTTEERNALAEPYRYLVVDAAKLAARSWPLVSLERADLEGYGYLGLYRAADDYDASKGEPAPFFRMRVWSEIRHGIREHNQTIRQKNKRKAARSYLRGRQIRTRASAAVFVACQSVEDLALGGEDGEEIAWYEVLEDPDSARPFDLVDGDDLVRDLLRQAVEQATRKGQAQVYRVLYLWLFVGLQKCQIARATGRSQNAVCVTQKRYRPVLRCAYV